MGGKIVYDHDVARSQQRHQMLLDPGAENLAVHWTIHHQWGDDSVAAQPRHEGRRLPVTMRTRPSGSGRAAWSWQYWVPVSSMNTSRTELSRPCVRFYNRRARATSGRVCSLARKLF
jgi:hypothetical protein